MKESFWAILITLIGITAIIFVYVFQTMTNTDEHNYNLLKETTEAAMYDALDLASYRLDGTVRIDREKFVENFLRRFAENANLARTYRIKIYDVSETPPKVSLEVSSAQSDDVKKGSANASGGSMILDFDIVNRLDAILETPR